MKKYFMRFLNYDIGSKIPHLLRTAFICLCSAVFLSQIGLHFDITRHLLTGIDILDGAMPASGNGIVEPGEVHISLTKGEPDDKIVILVNGDRYASFDSTDIKVSITNQSVIEIINDSSREIEVSVDNISDNLHAVYNVQKCTVDNLAVICRVIFKQ